jgi:hypothetical protein
MKVFAHVLRASGHKRGIRAAQPKSDDEHTRARLLFAQEEIVHRFPQGLPEKRPRDLLRIVRAGLAQNPEWRRQGWEPISRRTVKRAWEGMKKP